MTLFDGFDFDSTIRDYEYTRRAAYHINRIITAEDFEGKESEYIFQYLYKGIEFVSFHGYLKRYLYEKSKINEPFSSIPEIAYRQMIEESFREHLVPFSFGKTQKRPSMIIKGWLTQGSVRRETVFLLGFGLSMSVQDVSDFLIKVIKEADFDLQDPEEIIFWYCFKNGYSFAKAKSLANRYMKLPDQFDEAREMSADEIGNDEQLMCYLNGLKQAEKKNHYQQKAYEEFSRLIDRSYELAADIMTQENAWFEDERGMKKFSKYDISPSDIERMLCSGIPTTEKGQLSKASLSVLSEHFLNKRMSRQRIHNLLRQKLKVDRFDLITMLFFVYSSEKEDAEPEERFRSFLTDCNAMLTRCGMSGVYPVNPYEAFILMCLLTEDPLVVYADIWEMSYENIN